MVNNEGQLYTIEGIIASVLILATVYLVLSGTTVFTPAETHIYDMQLEQLGNDVLAVMDTSPIWNTADSPYPKSPLETYIELNQSEYFRTNFSKYSNITAGDRMDNLSFNARIVYRDITVIPTEIKEEYFSSSSGYENNYQRENAVKVSRWVNINNTGSDRWFGDARNQTVLLEVLLWRA